MFTKSGYSIIALGLLTAFVVIASVEAGLALLLGVSFAFIFGNPIAEYSRNWVSPVLGMAIVALGAGVNLNVVAHVGLRGIGYTVITILATLCLAFVLGRLLKVEHNIWLLLGIGTAICGGSAIAAASNTIRAKPEEVSVAMGTVFLLNALALFIFPYLGTLASLTQTQFGLWSALAVHDTSSVVATATVYGPDALAVATTTKLARALWIVPVAALAGVLSRDRAPEPKPKKQVPWFIIGFLAMAALFTYLPQLHPLSHLATKLGRRLLVFGIFLVGLNLSLATLTTLGWRSLTHGIVLWGIVSVCTFAAITHKLIGL